MNHSKLGWEFLLGIVLPLVIFAVFIISVFLIVLKQYLRNFEVIINRYNQVVTIKTLNLWSLLILRKEYNIVTIPLDNLKSMKIEKSMLQIPEWDTVKVADVFFLTLPNNNWHGNEKLFKKVKFSENKIKILSHSDEKWLDDFKIFLSNFCNL